MADSFLTAVAASGPQAYGVYGKSGSAPSPFDAVDGGRLAGPSGSHPLATISVTLRLNLSFTSRVHPAMLIEHRARLFPAIALADALLAIALLVSAATIAGNHDEVAAVFVSVAVVMLASLGLIEPATTKAAGLNP